MSKGFTLIEITVVLVILSFLAMMAYPSYRGLIRTHRVEAEAVELQADLMWAKAEATKLHKGLEVKFNKGWIVRQMESKEIYRKHGTPSSIDIELSRGLEEAPDEGFGDIQISGYRGYMGGTTPFVIFRSEGKEARVDVWPLGFADICSQTIKGIQKC